MNNRHPDNKPHQNTVLFIKYLDNITSIRPLNKEMIDSVRNMSDENKMAIIITFNNVLESVSTFIENTSILGITHNTPNTIP